MIRRHGRRARSSWRRDWRPSWPARSARTGSCRSRRSSSGRPERVRMERQLRKVLRDQPGSNATLEELLEGEREREEGDRLLWKAVHPELDDKNIFDPDLTDATGGRSTTWWSIAGWACPTCAPTTSTTGSSSRRLPRQRRIVRDNHRAHLWAGARPAAEASAAAGRGGGRCRRPGRWPDVHVPPARALADVAPGEAVLVEYGRRQRAGCRPDVDGSAPGARDQAGSRPHPQRRPAAAAACSSARAPYRAHYLAPPALVVRAMLAPGTLERVERWYVGGPDGSARREWRVRRAGTREKFERRALITDAGRAALARRRRASGSAPASVAGGARRACSRASVRDRRAAGRAARLERMPGLREARPARAGDGARRAAAARGSAGARYAARMPAEAELTHEQRGGR